MIFSCDRRRRLSLSQSRSTLRSQRQTKDLSHKLYDISQKSRQECHQWNKSICLHAILLVVSSYPSLSDPLLPFSLLFLANTYRFDSFELRIVGCHLLLIYVTYLLPALPCAQFLEDFNLVHCAFCQSQLPVLLISFAQHFLLCRPVLEYLLGQALLIPYILK